MPYRSTMQELKTSLLPVPCGSWVSLVTGRHMLLASKPGHYVNQQSQVFSWFPARLALCSFLLPSNVLHPQACREGERLRGCSLILLPFRQQPLQRPASVLMGSPCVEGCSRHPGAPASGLSSLCPAAHLLTGFHLRAGFEHGPRRAALLRQWHCHSRLWLILRRLFYLFRKYVPGVWMGGVVSVGSPEALCYEQKLGQDPGCLQQL